MGNTICIEVDSRLYLLVIFPVEQIYGGTLQ